MDETRQEPDSQGDKREALHNSCLVTFRVVVQDGDHVVRFFGEVVKMKIVRRAAAHADGTTRAMTAWERALEGKC